MNKKQLKENLYKGTKVLSEVADIAVHVAGSKVVSAIWVTSKLIDVGRRIFKKDNNQYFNDWGTLPLQPLDEFIFRMLESNENLKVLNPNEEGSEVKIVVADMGEFQIGWSVYTTWKDGPYIYPVDKIDEAKKYLAEVVWDSVNDKAKVRMTFSSMCMIFPDSVTDVLPSQVADDIWEDKVKMFLEKGFGRSLLLYGEPGTGKSFIIRHIAGKAGGRSLRIRAKDMTDNMFGEIMDFLKPSAVLIDDLDRAPDPAAVLEEFDDMKVREGLILATANELHWMDAATVRRFNTLEHIQCLDEAVLDKLLEEVDEKVREKIQDLPITYIDEYRKICEVMGHKIAEDSVGHLIDHRNAVLSILELETDTDKVSERKKKKRNSTADAKALTPR